MTTEEIFELELEVEYLIEKYIGYKKHMQSNPENSDFWAENKHLLRNKIVNKILEQV